MDAAVPVPEVWFRHEPQFQFRKSMRSPRISLMAYLMSRPYLGNTFELSGLAIPPYLGAQFIHDSSPQELFVSPINNAPARIVPPMQYDVLNVDGGNPRGTSVDGRGSLLCRRTEFGYCIDKVTADEAAILSITTNVCFFSAFTPYPQSLATILVFLDAFDVLGVRQLRVFKPEPENDWADRVSYLISEVGGKVQFIGREASLS